MKDPSQLLAEHLQLMHMAKEIDKQLKEDNISCTTSTVQFVEDLYKDNFVNNHCTKDEKPFHLYTKIGG